MQPNNSEVEETLIEADYLCAARIVTIVTHKISKIRDAEFTIRPLNHVITFSLHSDLIEPCS